MRRRYGSEVETRWRRAAAAVRSAVSGQDVLALRPATVSPHLPEGRVEAFQHWFDEFVRRAVLGDGAWLRPLVATAYTRAVTRAQRLTRTTIIPADMTDVIDALWRMTVVEFQGAAEAVSQRVARDAANAILHGLRPAAAARSMAEGIQAVGAVRSRATVEVMTVKAFTQGTLDQFAAARVTRVGVVPETVARVRTGDSRGLTGPGSRVGKLRVPSRSTVLRIRRAQQKLAAAVGGEVEVETAGDDDVCPICEDISESGPYTLAEAYSLIPAHPWCRCAFVPEILFEGDGLWYVFDADWSEESHPRGEGGRFAPSEEAAIELSKTQRESLRKVREKLAAMQRGEAFHA